MKILVIGAKGFVGSACAKHFNARGYKVFQADILNSSEKDYFQINTGAPDFNAVIKSCMPDVLVNASGSGDVGFSLREPELDRKLNVINVRLMLEAISRMEEPARFINFSSAAVYGNPEKLPVSESDPLRPVSPYGKNKLESEILLKEYFTNRGVPAISLRVFSAYGVGLKKQLFWDIYQKSKLNKTIELYGTGTESRDFINGEDLARAVETVIFKGAFNGGSLNLASGIELTISDAAEMLLELLGPEFTLRFTGEFKKGDPLNWRADITGLRRLGFEPFVTFEKGIEAYALWLKGL